MDYAGGTHIAKWQWDLMHDPGVVMRVFEKDEEAQLGGCTAPAPTTKGAKEGERAETTGTRSVDPQIGLFQSCKQVWYYHTAKNYSFEKAGWYKEQDYPVLIKNELAGFAYMAIEANPELGLDLGIFLLDGKDSHFKTAFISFINRSDVDTAQLESLLHSFAHVGFKTLQEAAFYRTGKVELVSIDFDLLSLGLGKMIANVFKAVNTRIIGYVTSSGVKLAATKGKTTTILGRWIQDMRHIKPHMQPSDFNVGTTFGKVAKNNGGFNFLNIPEDLATKAGKDFFELYNKPWLDAAISRGDDIILATKPVDKAIYFDDGTLTTFGQEIEYLILKRYKPINIDIVDWNNLVNLIEK